MGAHRVDSQSTDGSAFLEIIARTKGRPYSASYRWSGDGRVGWMPTGDRYLVLEGGTGYMKKGTGYWYLTEGDKPDGPDGLNQRPLMAELAAQPIADFAMLAALERYSDGFVAAAEEEDHAEWLNDLPPRTTSMKLLGDYRDMLPLRVWTKSVGGVTLPVKAMVTWWDGGQVICVVTYEWSDPIFPEHGTHLIALASNVQVCKPAYKE